PLPGLLARVPPDLRPAGIGAAAPAPVPAAARARRGRLRRPPTGDRSPAARPRWAAAAAPAAAAGAGPAGRLPPRPPPRAPAPAPHGGAGRPAAAPAMTVSGVNPAAHVRAVAALTATSWGTSIRLRVSGIPLNVQCWLVVRSRAGQSEVAGVWEAWNPGPVTVP